MSITPRQTKAGERRYDVRLRRGDGSVYTRSFRTRREAESYERAELAAKERGTWTDPRAGRITLADYARQWLEGRTVRGRRLAPRTVEQYDYLLATYLLPTFGTQAIGGIRAHDVRAWHGRLTSEAPASVTPKAYRLLHAICATALADGLIAANPCRVRAAGAERANERPLASPAQIDALAEAIEPRWRAMVYLAAYGALRFGELIGLRRCDIDLLHGEVVITTQLVEVGGALTRTAPKSAAGVRRVALPAFVVDEVVAHLERYVDEAPDAPLFTGARGGIPSRSKWSAIWAPARTAAGLPDTVHLHDLRHAGATLAAQAGATTKELMARLGHGSPRAALIYQHAADHRDREIAEGLQRIARPAMGTPPNGSARAIGARSRATNWHPTGQNSRPQAADLRLFGGDDGTRTHDPLLAKQVL